MGGLDVLVVSEDTVNPILMKRVMNFFGCCNYSPISESSANRLGGPEHLLANV